jgi:hypothetical protein
MAQPASDPSWLADTLKIAGGLVSGYFLARLTDRRKRRERQRDIARVLRAEYSRLIEALPSEQLVSLALTTTAAMPSLPEIHQLARSASLNAGELGEEVVRHILALDSALAVARQKAAWVDSYASEKKAKAGSVRAAETLWSADPTVSHLVDLRAELTAASSQLDMGRKWYDEAVDEVRGQLIALTDLLQPFADATS